MLSMRLLSIVAVAGCVSGAWAFDLTTSYSNGHITPVSDIGGTVTLDEAITKVASDDAIIGRFTQILNSQASYLTATVAIGDEVTGTWDVNQFNGALYGFNGTQSSKYYGAALGSTLTSTEDLTNTRYAWLCAGWHGDASNALTFFAGDNPFLNTTDNEPWSHGTDGNGNFMYSEGTNIGFGYNATDGGTYKDYYWVLAFDSSVDATSGNPLFTYRGGIHYSDTAVLNPVPEPTTLVIGAGLLALVARRKRR